MPLVGITTESFTRHKNAKQLDASKAGPSGHPTKKRKVFIKPDATNNLYNVDISNSFEVLSDSDPETETEHSQVHHIIPKKYKPPPIVVYSYIQDHMKSLNTIKEQLTDEISIKYRGNRIIIHTFNRPDYDKVKQIMHESKLDFHTYTPKEDRDHKLVLKNLPPTISPEEVKNSLEAQNIKIKKITQMVKKAGETTLIPLPLFVITAANESNIKEILKIKKVCYCVITWERYKSKNGITQCFKCQAFDHIASNCFKTPKCVNCAGNHLKNECDVISENNLKCINCGEQHQANYRQCPAYIKQLTLKHKNTNFKSQLDSKSTNYALRAEDFPKLNPKTLDSAENDSREKKQNIWPTHKPQTKEQGNESISDVLQLLKSFVQNINLSNIIRTIKNAITKIVSAPDNISKLGVILESIMELLG